MNIRLYTIPHKRQEYDTVGNWKVQGATLKEIIVSEMFNDDYHMLVAIHELIEAHLCVKRGIRQAVVDAFDMDYEMKRKKGDVSEPGDSKDAPYYKEHRFATKIERLLAKEFGVDWDAYEKRVNAL